MDHQSRNGSYMQAGCYTTIKTKPPATWRVACYGHYTDVSTGVVTYILCVPEHNFPQPYLSIMIDSGHYSSTFLFPWTPARTRAHTHTHTHTHTHRHLRTYAYSLEAHSHLPTPLTTISSFQPLKILFSKNLSKLFSNLHFFIWDGNFLITLLKFWSISSYKWSYKFSYKYFILIYS